MTSFAWTEFRPVPPRPASPHPAPRRLAALATMLLLLATACGPFSLVETEPRLIGDRYTVQPGQLWTHLRRTEPETWTLNGPMLDRLLLVADLAENATLFQSDGDRATMPTWRSSMTESEAMEFVEDSFAQLGMGQVRVGNLRPADFGDRPGFAFDMAYVDGEGLNKRGAAVAAVIDGKLNMMLFTAAATHYFAAGYPDVEQMARSIQVL